jgi:(p)ppGpp synthase/HD superfamily hydrolase
MDRLTKACYFASKKHENQRRKDKNSTPYINHPLHVANLLAEAGITDVDTLMAAVLHDTVEDTQTTKEELILNFGENVASIVLECSDDKTLHKVDRKKLQIEHTKTASISAKLVKLGDKYSNLSDLLGNPPEKWSREEIYGYSVWAYAVYQNLKGNNDIMDKKFEELFNKFGILTLSTSELESSLQEYYENINNSE